MLGGLKRLSSIAGLHGRTLKEPWLFREQAFIDGTWTDSSSADLLPVHNPVSGKVC